MNFSEVKKSEKLFSELYTIDEFLSHYKGAGRKELMSRLSTLKNGYGKANKNEIKAIKALLA